MLELRDVNQRFDHETVRAAGNVVHPGHGEHPVDIGVLVHAGCNAVERTQHGRGVHILTLEQADEDLVAGKLGAQFAFEHGGWRVGREVQLGCVVEVQPQQECCAHHMDEHDDRNRGFPSKDARLRDTQEEGALRDVEQQGSQSVDQVRSSVIFCLQRSKVLRNASVR
ncbi:hypothetical protein FQZ97_706090 [compost metagenome]